MPALPHKIIRSELFRATAILVIILHVCFLPELWGNKNLMAGAQLAGSVMPYGAFAGKPSLMSYSKELDGGGGGFQGEPWLRLAQHQYLQEHTAPLWNPYSGYGVPEAANQQSQPFYPLKLLLMLRVTVRTYNWFLLARLLLAGISGYLYLRFFVTFWPAVAGAVASMLAGYYVLFITMPELSAEVHLMTGLAAAELMLRRRSYWGFAAFAAAVMLILLGGMPESELLILAFLYLYILFRIVSDGELRAAWRSVFAIWSAATAMGIALSAFFVFPFLEYMHRSFDTHQAHNLGGFIMGHEHDHLTLAVFSYFFPMLYGPVRPYQTVLGPQDFGMRNYIGFVPFFLLLVAFAANLSKKSDPDKRLKWTTWFYLAAMAVVVLKRYGFAGVNWIGSLPFFTMVNFPKYEEVLISISAAALAAFGLERIVRRDVSRRTIGIVIGLCAALVLAALLASRHELAIEFADHHIRRFPLLNIALSVLLLIALTAVFIAQKRLGPALTIIVTADLCLNFIVPNYYWLNKPPRIDHDPLAGAPFIEFLRSHQGYDRTYARDGLLFPDWSSAFLIYDVRDLDAMYEGRFFPFIRNFLVNDPPLVTAEDLSDRFTGNGNYDMATPAAERFMQLSSVKYIGSLRPYPIPNRMIAEALKSARSHLIAGREGNISARLFFLNGEVRDGLGEHPPYERLPYSIHVGDEARPTFCFSYAIDPAVFHFAGDGVEFIIEVKDAAGKITKHFSNYIDPKHNQADRRWVDGQIDLSAYRGQNIELLFTTTPGPKGDTTYDWAAWSNFHMLGQDIKVIGEPPPFHLIYNAEALIYRYDDALPRAAIFNHAEMLGENDVLHRLADPALDIFQTVVIDDSKLTAAQRAAVAAINQNPPAKVSAATITDYQSRDVHIDANLTQPGILVLNDTDYPGWEAEVDGHAEPILNTNYLFRGVLLTTGRHNVRFFYRPASFRAGSQISLAGLGILVLGGVYTRRRRRFEAV